MRYSYAVVFSIESPLTTAPEVLNLSNLDYAFHVSSSSLHDGGDDASVVLERKNGHKAMAISSFFKYFVVSFPRSSTVIFI